MSKISLQQQYKKYNNYYSTHKIFGWYEGLVVHFYGNNLNVIKFIKKYNIRETYSVA